MINIVDFQIEIDAILSISCRIAFYTMSLMIENLTILNKISNFIFIIQFVEVKINVNFFEMKLKYFLQ